MTTQDQNKKTLRHFQCRDYLWEVFEQMSAELECSTDYLINEAMRQYARSRNYGTSRSQEMPAMAQAPQAAAPAAAPVAQQGGPGAIPSLRGGGAAKPSLPSPPPPRPRRSDAAASRSSLPATPRPPASMPPPPPGRRVSSRAPAPAQPSTAPPPLPGGRSPSHSSMPATQRSQLYIIFNGQKIPVTKDEFVIGRGTKSADLAIKDGNISRRHAAVVFHNGAFFMKDLGSTNGVEFQGRRFDYKRIEEGDVYRMCDYELMFTYQ